MCSFPFRLLTSDYHNQILIAAALKAGIILQGEHFNLTSVDKYRKVKREPRLVWHLSTVSSQTDLSLLKYREDTPFSTHVGRMETR